jgi:DsbC/DsbD-like thiol-disulfide interchange protein
VHAGGTVRIALSAKIEPGWKLYALTQPEGGPQRLAIALPKGTPFTLNQKQIGGPVPKVHKDENFSMDTLYYEDAAAFTVPVTVSRDSAAGRQQIPLDVTFQACGQSLCLRPFTQRVTVELTIAR